MPTPFNKLLGILNETTFTEARNNDIAEHNIYSTQKVINIAEERGDDYGEIGDFIYIKPEKQPCEYAQFTNKLFCVSNPSKPDWSNFLEHMRPIGSEFIFLFRKSDEGMNKKKLREYDVLAVATWGQWGRKVSTMSVEEIAHHLYNKALEEFGPDNMTYTIEDLQEYASDMKEEDMYSENYSSNNRLIPAKEFLSILSDGGVSKGSFLSIIN